MINAQIAQDVFLAYDLCMEVLDEKCKLTPKELRLNAHRIITTLKRAVKQGYRPGSRELREMDDGLEYDPGYEAINNLSKYLSTHYFMKYDDGYALEVLEGHVGEKCKDLPYNRERRHGDEIYFIPGFDCQNISGIDGKTWGEKYWIHALKTLDRMIDDDFLRR